MDAQLNRERQPSGLIRVGLLGCGTVGGALLEMIDTDAGGIRHRSGLALAVTKVAVAEPAKLRPVAIGTERASRDPLGVVADPSVDVVVELLGGIEPARTVILEALRVRKPVVTANKQLLAECGTELFTAAEASNTELLFEASVGGAIPLLRALHVSLSAEKIARIVGIVNGTTNHVLSRMSEGNLAYTDALGEAKELGYAERDPTADVEGYDSAQKAAILARIAFNAEVSSGDVYREGITQLDTTDVEFAGRLGYVIKLLAIAELVDRGDGTINVRVHPTMVPVEHPLASVHGSYNAVFVEGEACGEIMLFGRGAGGRPTASAVLGDVIEAGRSLTGARPVRLPPHHTVRVSPIDELRSQYYVTMDVADRPGVLAAVAQIFGDHSVSIRLMEQVELGSVARLVFVTHVAREADVQATLADLDGLEPVKRIGCLLRVMGQEP